MQYICIGCKTALSGVREICPLCGSKVELVAGKYDKVSKSETRRIVETKKGKKKK